MTTEETDPFSSSGDPAAGPDAGARGFRFRKIDRAPLTDPDVLITEPCRRLVTAYRLLPPDPTWSIDLLPAIGPILQHLFLIRRLGPGRYHYRVRGEEVRRLIGRDDAPDLIDGASGNAFDRELARYLDYACDTGSTMRCYGDFEQRDRLPVLFESVDLPFLDDGGQRSVILGALCGIERDQAVRAAPVR